MRRLPEKYLDQIFKKIKNHAQPDKKQLENELGAFINDVTLGGGTIGHKA